MAMVVKEEQGQAGVEADHSFLFQYLLQKIKEI